jgi:hypothetical protein
VPALTTRTRLLGPRVELRHTTYDFNDAAERIRRTNYPGAEFASNNVLHPRSDERMLRVFSQAEVA